MKNTQKILHPLSKSRKKTLRQRKSEICGEIRSVSEGWIIAHIYGKPLERGYAHGHLLQSQLSKISKQLDFLLVHDMNICKSEFMKASRKVITPILKDRYPEFYEELRGISYGSGVPLSLLIAWNSYLSLYSHFCDGSPIRCSAFLATGKATEDGGIIMAHETHSDFLSGWLANVMLYVAPHQGNAFVMQTLPGYIASSTDWFLSSSGIIGCETTIANVNYKPKFGDPYFCRIRKAMQYGNSLEEYEKIMSHRNAGDYACSWLFGDTRTNEIMLFELGLHYKNVKRTSSGVFYGMNRALGVDLREQETTDGDSVNIATSSGARMTRLDQLLNHTYKGKINTSNAKKIMADHYDTYLGRDSRNSRSICNHTEENPEQSSRPPYFPFGCTDAKVVNTTMAKQLIFEARFGSACGRPFSVKGYVKRAPEHKAWANVLPDIPTYAWTRIEK
jgi:hypothetical protein